MSIKTQEVRLKSRPTPYYGTSILRLVGEFFHRKELRCGLRYRVIAM